MKSLLLVIALVGCSASDSDFPVLVQGNTLGTGGGGALLVSGNVCLVGNIQILTSCATTGAGGLVVTVAGASAVTNDDGSFIVSPAAVTTHSTILVTGPQIIPSQQFVTTTNVVPVIATTLFSQVLNGNNIVVSPNTGSIIASVLDANGEPVQGVTAISVPTVPIGPFFDNNLTDATLATTATGTQGIVFFPGLVPPGPVTLSFINASNPTDQSTISDVRVLEGGVSFVNAKLSQ